LLIGQSALLNASGGVVVARRDLIEQPGLHAAQARPRTVARRHGNSWFTARVTVALATVSTVNPASGSPVAAGQMDELSATPMTRHAGRLELAQFVIKI